MRVLMLSALDVWSLAGQGGAPSLFKTLEGYGRRGHQVDFICPTVGANHHFGQPAGTPPAIDGVTFHLVHVPSLQELPFALPAAAATVDQKMRFATLFPLKAAQVARRLLRQGDFDLVYGYEVHGVLAARLARRGHEGLPLVTRFQGTVMRPHIESAAARLRRYEEVLALETPADLYIMTNDGTQGDEVLARLNPASTGRVRFWRNGLDLGHIRPPSGDEAATARAALGIANDDFVLVTAVRLARWKRVDRAIDALARLRADLPRARLIVVGDGEERANLETQARERGVAEAVTFAGAVPQAEVQRYLWASDVFLSMNELSNVGNPLLEAMTAGRCILTLDEGDTRDLIADGVTGRLLPAGEPNAIAIALAELAGNEKLRARLGAAAAEYAGHNFWSWEERLDAEVNEVASIVRPMVRVR